jgi:hypothetical protein
MEKEDGSEQAAARPSVSGYAAPNDRARAVPTVEATVGVRSRGTCHDGAGTVAVERKAGERHGGEEGVREAWRSTVTARHEFF